MAAYSGFFLVGEKFFSLDELNRAKLEYEKSNYVNMVMRDAKSLDSVCKYAPKRVRGARSELRYYTVRLCCTFGGKKYKKQGHNKRLTGTRKVDCKAFVRLLLSEDGQSLDVVESQLDHSNHVISKEVYMHLPMQRRLDDSHVLQAETLLSVCGNQKLVQQHMQSVSGKVVLLKDIANISHKMKKQPVPNNLKSVLQQLEETGDSVVDVLVSEDNTFKGIFYQDLYMQNVFEAYPEMLLIGETFELVDLHLTAYIVLTVDGNGQSGVVALLLLADELRSTVFAAVEAFQHHNPAWLNTQTILTDADFPERQVLTTLFPDVSLILCLNHMIRTFRLDVSSEKLAMSNSDRDACLAILREMVYSPDEAAYNVQLERLNAVGSSNVLEYFQPWHETRSQWVEGLKEQHLTLGETTAQRLESVGAKMKNVCNEHAALQQFFSEFRGFLASMRADRMHKALTILTRKPTIVVPEDLLPYRDSLTPYAFRIVFQQYGESQLLSTSGEVDEDVDTFVFQSAAGTVTTRPGCCSCRIYTSTKLPCKHLLYVRRLRGTPFDETVFDSRWNRAEYMAHCRLNDNGDEVDIGLLDGKTDDSETPQPEQRSGEYAEKLRKAHHMADQLARLCAKPADAEGFTSRLKVLQKLYENWSRGVEVELIKMETTDDATAVKRRRGRPPKSCGQEVTTTTKSSPHKHARPGRPKGSGRIAVSLPSWREGSGRKRSSALHDEDFVYGVDNDEEDVTEAVEMECESVALRCHDSSENFEPELDLTASAEDDGSVVLVAAEDTDIADINDCISEDPGLQELVSAEATSLMAVGNGRLEVHCIDPTLATPRRKRGRPPKSSVLPRKQHCYIKTNIPEPSEDIEACDTLQQVCSPSNNVGLLLSSVAEILLPSADDV